MKAGLLALPASLIASAGAPAAAFSPPASAPARPLPSSTTRLHQVRERVNAAQMRRQRGQVDLADLYSPRDVYSMEQWAAQYGMQKADGVELYSEDGADYQLVTQSGVGAGQTVVFVPNSIVLNSAAIQQEFGTSLQQAEAAVVQIDQGTEFRLPLFRLMVKILAEYEKGQESPYYPWLASLPRQFFNGVSMTKSCTNCLPPYAGWLTSNERINYSHFDAALRQGWVPLLPETISYKKAVRWAYNVALTRFHEAWNPERIKVIGPVADMLNHASEPNCEISVDYEGNVAVTSLCDIPAGSPLTVSYKDPTNPTPIFSQYGFLPQDCATIFCKAMHLDPQIKELGYEFNELLFQTETGEVAPKVWDIFLYAILQQNDPGAAQQFYMAVQNGDEGTKQQYHGEWFAYTLDALKQHVYSILQDADSLTLKAMSYDQAIHPRVPVIVAHNELVRRTFAMTSSQLEQMG